MHILVVNEMEKKAFKDVFTKVGVEQCGFHYNEPCGTEKRYLIVKNEEDNFLSYEDFLASNAVGTVEVNKYTVSHSIVQPYTDVDLLDIEQVSEHVSDTYEIGKLCLRNEMQGVGFLKDLFVILYEHQKMTGAKYYLAQMVLPLYEMISKGLGLDITVLGAPDNDEIPGVPILIDYEEAIKNKKVQRIIRHAESKIQAVTA